MATRTWRRIGSLGLGALAAATLMVATVDDAAARDRRSTSFNRGGHWHGGGGHAHFHHRHFHSFVFTGVGLGYGGYYYPAYYGYPPLSTPVYLPPPVYMSKDDTGDCYNTVPRSPGLADLYTCGGQYIGPISVP